MFASLHLPDFTMAAALRHRPEWRNAACAILVPSSGKTPRERLSLYALNAAARGTGIEKGWPLNRSLVRCPALKVIERDPGAEEVLRGELVRLGESLTPDLELTAPDTVTLDLSLRRGGDLPAPCSLAGLECRWGFGPTPDLAWLAALQPEWSGRVVAPADLMPLSIEWLEVLSASGETLTLLDWWGVRTLGDFMVLPRQALIERLGGESGRWHDLLHGKLCRLLRLHRPPQKLAQRMEFEEPAVALEPVIFAAMRLLHALGGRLASRALAARCLEVRLELESGEAVARRITLAEPQLSAETMLPPLQTWLETLSLGAAISALEIDAETTFASASQRDWLRRELPEPARWGETLARLEAMLGSDRVGIPVPGDSHAPEAFTLRSALAASPGGESSPPVEPACPVPLHRFRPPLPVAVAHEWTGTWPAPLALLNGPHPGSIAGCRGPYPVSGHWWEPGKAWRRLEWDIQMENRELLRLVFETPDRWQIDGIYR